MISRTGPRVVEDPRRASKAHDRPVSGPDAGDGRRSESTCRVPGLDETVFGCWQRDRTSEDWPSLTAGLRRLLNQAGLPSGTRDLWHKIRRTFATQVCGSGGIAVAQSMLGHSSVAVTKRYIDPSQMPDANQADYLTSPLKASES